MALHGDLTLGEVPLSDHGLRTGTIDLRSAGPITFSPEGMLFVADNASAKIFALDVGDDGPATGFEPFDLADVDTRVASFLGCVEQDVVMRDMAVHPVSRRVYLSVQAGTGDNLVATVLRVDPLDGSLSAVALHDVPVAEFTLSDAPVPDDERLDITLPLGAEGEELTIGDRTIRILRQPIRTSTVTDMAFLDGNCS